MARRASLKPQLNQIRTWVQEGRTDQWIAHEIGSTPSSIASFRRTHDIKKGIVSQRVEAVTFEAADMLAETELPDLPVPQEFLLAADGARAEAPAEADDAPAAPRAPRRSRRRGAGQGAGEPVAATAPTPTTPPRGDPPSDGPVPRRGLDPSTPIPYDEFVRLARDPDGASQAAAEIAAIAPPAPVVGDEPGLDEREESDAPARGRRRANDDGAVDAADLLRPVDLVTDVPDEDVPADLDLDLELDDEPDHGVPDDDLPEARMPQAAPERATADDVPAEGGGRRRRRRRRRGGEGDPVEEPTRDTVAPAAPAQRDGAHGAAARPGPRGALRVEGVFDHGDEGYGLWLDAAVSESDVYTEHWASARAVTVTVEADRIVVRRADRGDAR